MGHQGNAPVLLLSTRVRGGGEELARGGRVGLLSRYLVLDVLERVRAVNGVADQDHVRFGICQWS